MSRRVGGIPAVAVTLNQAAAIARVDPALLKGQIFHGLLRAKRTSEPYRSGEPAWGLSWTGGKYLISIDDLLDWMTGQQSAESPQNG